MDENMWSDECSAVTKQLFLLFLSETILAHAFSLSYSHNHSLMMTVHMTCRKSVYSSDEPALFLSSLSAVTEHTLSVSALSLLCEGVRHR